MEKRMSMLEIVAAYEAARTQGQAYRALLLLRKAGANLITAVLGNRGDTVAFLPGPDHWHGEKKALVMLPLGAEVGKSYWISVEWRGSVGFAIAHGGAVRKVWQKPDPGLRKYIEGELRKEGL